MRKLVKESISDLNNRPKTKTKDFYKALTQLDESLTYLTETDHPDLWFLKENPDIKRILEEMNDLYFEFGNHLENIDWGKTDWQHMKHWNWNK